MSAAKHIEIQIARTSLRIVHAAWSACAREMHDFTEGYEEIHAAVVAVSGALAKVDQLLAKEARS